MGRVRGGVEGTGRKEGRGGSMKEGGRDKEEGWGEREGAGGVGRDEERKGKEGERKPR